MRYSRALVFTSCLLVSLATTSRAETITVSAAVSLRDAVTDAAKSYEKATGDHIDFTFGASGQLAAQIENGAPVDAFISAAYKQVGDLATDGLIQGGSRRDIASNELVLIVPVHAAKPPNSFDALGSTDVTKLAIGEPKTVPAGHYAMQVLQATAQEQALHDRLVFGSNVRQVLDYVERGEVTAGIVYATDAKQAGDKVKVVATADPTMHEPIVYPAVIIKSSTKKETTMKFLDYLATGAGRAAFAARGFAPPPAATTAPTAK